MDDPDALAAAIVGFLEQCPGVSSLHLVFQKSDSFEIETTELLCTKYKEPFLKALAAMPLENLLIFLNSVTIEGLKKLLVTKDKLVGLNLWALKNDQAAELFCDFSKN